MAATSLDRASSLAPTVTQSRLPVTVGVRKGAIMSKEVVTKRALTTQGKAIASGLTFSVAGSAFLAAWTDAFFMMGVYLFGVLYFTGAAISQRGSLMTPKVLEPSQEQDDPYVLKSYLDYQFLAELEHEFEVPHSSHSFKACTRYKCMRELKELDDIANGVEEKPAKVRTNIFAELTPNEARQVGYPLTDFPSYHDQANHVLNHLRESQGVPTKFYPDVDKALLDSLPPGATVDNIFDSVGNVINQKIVTAEGEAFMRVAWDRHRAKMQRQSNRAIILKEIEDKRKLEEELKAKLAQDSTPMVLPPGSETIIFGDDTPYNYLHFNQALENLKAAAYDPDEGPSEI
jgi:hypothetical protein